MIEWGLHTSTSNIYRFGFQEKQIYIMRLIGRGWILPTKKVQEHECASMCFSHNRVQMHVPKHMWCKGYIIVRTFVFERTKHHCLISSI